MDDPSLRGQYNLRIRSSRIKLTLRPFACKTDIAACKTAVLKGHRRVEHSRPCETVTAALNDIYLFISVFLQQVQTTRAKDGHKHCKSC